MATISGVHCTYIKSRFLFIAREFELILQGNNNIDVSKRGKLLEVSGRIDIANIVTEANDAKEEQISLPALEAAEEGSKSKQKSPIHTLNALCTHTQYTQHRNRNLLSPKKQQQTQRSSLKASFHTTLKKGAGAYKLTTGPSNPAWRSRRDLGGQDTRREVNVKVEIIA